MSQEIQAQVVKNFPTILNNFKKIGGWLVKGETEASPFPPAIKAFMEGYEGLTKTVTGLSKSQTATNKQITGLEEELKTLKKTIADMSTAYDELDDRMNNLDEPAALAEPKPKSKPKSKPKVETVEVEEVAEPTQLEASAAAIGAGELSAGAVAEIDDLLDAL